MAIGRVSGPMLFANLERQGYDLQVDNGLIYFDVNQRRVGINTDSPDAELAVVGNVHVTENLTIDSALSVAKTSDFSDDITVHASAYVQGLAVNDVNDNLLYTLPTTAPTEGKVIGYTGSAGANGTSWVTQSSTPVIRRSYHYEIDVVAGGTYTFEMDLNSISAIVYNLTVSQPCTIEVHGLPDYSQSNPYTFIATADHLTDDGSVYFSDGSVIQQRQYNIFANLEETPQERFFVRLTNISTTETLSIDLLYFSAVTGTTGVVVPQMQMEIVDGLPSSGQQGEVVYDRVTDSVYVWVDTAWQNFYATFTSKIAFVSGLPATGAQGQMVYEQFSDSPYVWISGTWRRFRIY